MWLLRRRELVLTYDQERKLAVCRALNEAGIGYAVKARNTAQRPGRGHMPPGINRSAAWEYRIYVDRRDLDRAQTIARGR